MLNTKLLLGFNTHKTPIYIYIYMFYRFKEKCVNNVYTTYIKQHDVNIAKPECRMFSTLQVQHYVYL